MSENGSLDTENDTFEGVESREIANTTSTLPTTTLLNNQQVNAWQYFYSRADSAIEKDIIYYICLKRFLFNLAFLFYLIQPSR